MYKVKLFLKGHKNTLPYGFDIYLVNIKTIRKIAQMFVAFSEKLNFTKESSLLDSIPHTVNFATKIIFYSYHNGFSVGSPTVPVT